MKDFAGRVANSISRDLPSLLAALGGFVLFFLLAGAALETGLFSATMAAWIQAVFSVAAIFAAAWLNDRDRRMTREAAGIRQAQAAATMARDLVELIHSANGLMKSRQCYGPAAEVLGDVIRRRVAMLEALPPAGYPSRELVVGLFGLMNVAMNAATIVDGLGRLKDPGQIPPGVQIDDCDAQGHQLLERISMAAREAGEDDAA